MKHLLAFSERVGNFQFWRYLTNFWTVIFLGAIIYDYIYHNLLDEQEIILVIAGIYCASLAIYSAEKEFRRWHHMHDSIHPGEMYAIIWTVFVFGLIAVQSYLQLEYHMPPEVGASYIAVISILAITRESKNLFKKKSKRE
jgi:hypothetical protein